MEQQIRFCTAADGVRIAYATVGSGPPLIKAANWLNHLEYDWQSPIWRPLFEELARNFTLIRYDERGNGLSDWKAEFSLDAFVQDLEAVVEAAGLVKFALLGISQGGAVAVRYAVRHPERVTQMILHGAYSRGWAVRGNPEEAERRRVMMDLIRLGWGQDNPAFRQLWTTLYIPQGTPEQMHWFNEMQRLSTSPENALRLFDTFSMIDVAAELPQVRTPTLVTHARGDAAVPYEAGRRLAARIPGARLVTLETGNHLILEGEPAWPGFVEEIRSFLGVPEAQPSPAPARDSAKAATGRAPAPAPPLTPGATLAHYQIVESLGAGGMGRVYRARDTRLERNVALKLLAEHSGASPERLLSEARAASALNHPNVATVYEVGEESGHAYIAMECVEGRPLSEQIPHDGLPAETVNRYGVQIASALSHAHDRGVIHRDLKSANIVITPEGAAKVLDFGLASRVQNEISEATRSIEAQESAPTVAGTLHYMAPEVLRGEPADARSDIWALGVVLYEMAAGKLPFQGRTGFELSSTILREPAAPLPAHVPPGLRGVIQRCLAKDVGHRYRSTAQVHAALEALSSDSGLVPPAPTAVLQDRGSRRIPRWAQITGLAVLLGGLLYAGRGFLALRAPGEEGSKAAPAGPRTSSGGRASGNAEANEYFERGLAIQMAKQGDLRRARSMFDRALELDPHFAEARAWRGFSYFLEIDSGASSDLGLLYRAEEELRQALLDDPECARAYSVLAAVYHMQRRKELVPAAAETALRLNPNDLDARNWLMHFHRMNGDTAFAMGLTRENLRRDPLFWPSRMNLGELLRVQGDYEGALREQNKVLEQDPQNLYALRNIARVYFDQRDLRQARATLERVPPENRSNLSVRTAWAVLFALEGKRREALREWEGDVAKSFEWDAMGAYNAAEFYAVVGDSKRALDWLERAVRNGDERLDWFERAPLLESIRGHERFRQILNSISFRHGGRAGAPASGGVGSAFVIQNPSSNREANELLQRAMMFTRYQLDPLRARPLLKRALELDPDFNEARVNYALTYLVGVDTGVSNDPADIYRAEEELRRVLQRAPQMSRAHALMGAVHFYQGRGDLAVAASQEAIRLHPGDFGGRTWLMIYHRVQGNSDEAIREARSLLETEPLFWPPRYHLGEAYRELGKIAEAVREQEKILEQDPQNVTALRCLARTHLDAGKPALARQALERMRPEDRKNLRVRLLNAQLLAAEGKRDLALRELDDQLLKFADLHPLATLDAAEMFAQAGEKEKALEWLDRAMRKGDGRVDWIRRDPLLANVRELPRFKQILDSMEFRRQQHAQ